MPKTSGSVFEGMFDERLNQAPEPRERNEGRAEPEPEVNQTPAAERSGPGQGRSVGRPKGKRSDPNYKQFSVLLRKQAVREATHLLDYQDRGQDFSGLLQKLLDQWLKAQQKKAH